MGHLIRAGFLKIFDLEVHKEKILTFYPHVRHEGQVLNMLRLLLGQVGHLSNIGQMY